MTIRELLTDLAVPFAEHGESPHVTAGRLGVVCPWCGGGTNKFGLGIHVATLRCSCWKCGRHTISSVLRELTGRPWGVIRGWIDALGGDRDDSPVVRPIGRYQEPGGVGDLLPVHRRYLEDRGFDPDRLTAEWGVRAIGNAGKYKWRLFLPVFDRQKPVTWTTRAVGNVELRYLSAPPSDESKPLKETLYGDWRAEQAVVVVEGPTDVWRVGPGAVATYGLSYTAAQMCKLARYPLRAIAFDNEPEAQRVARRLASDLAPFPGSTYVVTLSGADPDTSPPDEIAELRKRFLE